MYLERIDQLCINEIKSPVLMKEICQICDEYEKTIALQSVRSRARSLGILSDFNALYKVYEKTNKKELMLMDDPSHITQFANCPALRCGDWIADETGIRMLTDKGIIYACRHPIYISMILVNLETGKHKVEISFRTKSGWHSLCVSRSIIANRSTIIQLADYGVLVTSESAPALVHYLSEIEADNPSDIPQRMSTSRLGWISDGRFMPYEADVVFDDAQNLQPLFDSIKQVGSRQKWYECIKKIRKTKRFEVLIHIAASLASVLIDLVGALPFVVCLWGPSGRGKTVLLMLAASIWADPSEGAYITDAKATTTAMEIRLNTLNSLPMLLDDMAQIKTQYDGDLSKLIYFWCAGSGRSRSNKELGLNSATIWHNAIITNAEHSLITETMQGGAINRVIDIEMDEGYLFENGNETAETLRQNFGFGGQEFVELIQTLEKDEIKTIQKKYENMIKDYAKSKGIIKEEKQILPMSIILTADELSEQYIFKDDVRLDFVKCVDLLKTQGEVSEHERAYRYLIETITSNLFRFCEDYETDGSRVELWGDYDDSKHQCAIIYRTFDKILTDAGFHPRAFLS